MIKLDNLKGHIPDLVLEQIPSIKEINTPLRLAHFISQCSHESAGFSRVFENLNYSSDALRRIFPKRFTYDHSIACARDPVKIGNCAYANRMGNGDEQSGDGYKYRGRGFIQLTGKVSYDSFGKFIGVDCINKPDLVATKYPLSSAAWFFTINNIWKVCDRGDTEDVIASVTKRINPALHGLADRTKRFKEINSLL